MNITRILFLGLFMVCATNFYAQNSVNDYEYIIVPEGYTFLKGNDTYQLNSLTKFLFKKYGFTAFIRGEELPEDLKVNGCKGLRADVRKNSGFLKTKLIVDLIDCNGAVLFSTKEGSSKEKEYKNAYHEALRDAFTDIKALNYKYNGKKQVSSNEKVVAESTNAPKVRENVQIENKIPKQVSIEENTPVAKATSYSYNEEIYFFESKAYGYEILQNKNSIGKIFKSSRKNSYIIQAGDLSGIGYFDSYGNFTLERVNPATDKVIVDTFARQ